MYWWNGSCY